MVCSKDVVVFVLDHHAITTDEMHMLSCAHYKLNWMISFTLLSRMFQQTKAGIQWIGVWAGGGEEKNTGPCRE